MKQYIIPILAYLLAVPLLDFLNVDNYISYSARAILTFALLVYFWKDYKISFKLSYFALLIGIVTFISWISLENMNLTFGNEAFVPINNLVLAAKLFSMILVAPIVEELFARDFLARFFVNPNNFEKVKIGAFGLLSFIITVLVFGFSHSRWVQGIIAGILYSTVLYKTRRIDACIQAHAVTNILLALLAIYTQNWILW